MAEVVLKEGDSFEKALRIFKHRIKKEGIVRQLKQRRYFEKPSDKLRQQKMKAGFNKQNRR